MTRHVLRFAGLTFLVNGDEHRKLLVRIASDKLFHIAAIPPCTILFEFTQSPAAFIASLSESISSSPIRVRYCFEKPPAPGLKQGPRLRWTQLSAPPRLCNTAPTCLKPLAQAPQEWRFNGRPQSVLKLANSPADVPHRSVAGVASSTG